MVGGIHILRTLVRPIVSCSFSFDSSLDLQRSRDFGIAHLGGVTKLNIQQLVYRPHLFLIIHSHHIRSTPFSQSSVQSVKIQRYPVLSSTQRVSIPHPNSVTRGSHTSLHHSNTPLSHSIIAACTSHFTRRNPSPLRPVTGSRSSRAT